MPDKCVEEAGPLHAPPLDNHPLDNQTEPDGEVTEALSRVQEAVIDMKDGELRESLEAAIEATDSARETLGQTEGDRLSAVADAFEEVLDELEQGKVANLLPTIEQAQSIGRLSERLGGVADTAARC